MAGKYKCMVMRFYDVRFKIKGRGNKIFTWKRFARDLPTARKSAKIALDREYPSGYKLSVKVLGGKG